MPNSTEKTASPEQKGAAAGLAALSICESLLLALSDLEVLGVKDAGGILEDAAAAHRSAGHSTKDAPLQREAAAIIERIIAGRNGIPRP
jgi:hypothetical protein